MMNTTAIYSSPRWRRVRAQALERDDHRCTVSRLLGGECSPGPLHAHHIVPVSEGGAAFDLENVGTSCSAHHPMWEALRRVLVRRLTGEGGWRHCPHAHRSAEARRQCEARLNRRVRQRELSVA